MAAVNIVRGPEFDGRRARLVLDAPTGPGPVDGVVLVLHGGRATSTAPTAATQLAVARMLPFGPAVTRAARADGLRVVVARLRYRVRGWNGRRQDPLVDTRWALETIRARFNGAPIVLLGHSMGGRAALDTVGEPGVVGVVGLAPWVDPTDRVGFVEGRRIDVVHGTADQMTDPRASWAWTEAARRRGATVSYTAVEGAGHPMLARAGWWHRTAASNVIEQIGAAGVADVRDARATRQNLAIPPVYGLGTDGLRSATGSRRQS